MKRRGKVTQVIDLEEDDLALQPPRTPQPSVLAKPKVTATVLYKGRMIEAYQSMVRDVAWATINRVEADELAIAVGGTVLEYEFGGNTKYMISMSEANG